MLYYDLDREKFVTQAGYDSDNTGFSRKMGSGGDLVIEFSRGGVTEDLPETAQVRFGLKNAGEYEGDLVALAETDDFIKVPVTTGRYSAPLDLNTAAIKALLLVDGDESNDLEKVVIMGQMDFRNDPADPWSKSPTLSVTVHNSVLQDTDGMEDDPVPPYPLAAEVIAMQVALDSLMAAKDLEAMDTGRSYDIGEAFYWIDGKNYRVAAAAAAGETPATDPAKFQRLGPQTDEEILTAVESESGRSVSIDGAKLDTLAKVNSIANKEAAYALTGVAAGTVYKTTDTGQVLERTSRLDTAWDDGSEFLIQGGTYTNGGVQELIPAGEVATAVYRKTSPADNYGYLAFSPAEVGSELWSLYEDASDVSGTAGKWGIKDEIFAGQAQWESVEDSDTVHPADATWVALNAGLAVPTLTKTEPRNWKHDGTILVNDNDEKQLLTNLPDGQQVKIVGEGGRIERFNGDGDGLNEGDFKILVNHPDNPVISGMRINGIYSYDPSNYFYLNDDGVILGNYGDGTYVFHTSSVQWSAPINGNATPDLMSPWTAQSTEAQGYAAMTSDMITRQPTATESNWFTIKNTVYLSVRDTGYGGVTVNGVAIPNNTTRGVGWVPVGEIISTNDTGNGYNLEKINSGSLVMSGSYEMMRWGTTDLTLPDIFPSGATVQIKTL